MNNEYYYIDGSARFDIHIVFKDADGNTQDVVEAERSDPDEAAEAFEFIDNLLGDIMPPNLLCTYAQGVESGAVVEHWEYNGYEWPYPELEREYFIPGETNGDGTPKAVTKEEFTAWMNKIHDEEMKRGKI